MNFQCVDDTHPAVPLGIIYWTSDGNLNNLATPSKVLIMVIEKLAVNL